MKYKEISALSFNECNEKILVEKEHLRKLRFAHTISPIENAMKIRHLKKHIAQLKTAQRAQELEKK